MAGQVQSLLFPRSKFTVEGAKSWARAHGFKAMKVDVTQGFIRVRQLAPSLFPRKRTGLLDPHKSHMIKAVYGFSGPPPRGR